MLTTLLTELETKLKSIPNGTLPSPWSDFPNAMAVVRGVVPEITKEDIANQIHVVVVPDIFGQSIEFTEGQDDRCGAQKTYQVLLGVMRKLQTRDVTSVEPATVDEVYDLFNLSEALADYLASNGNTATHTLQGTPELVFLVETERYVQRMFKSWWRIVYAPA